MATSVKSTNLSSEAASAASETPMLVDIYRQPDVLRGLADRAAEIYNFWSENLRDRHMVAFGSGDGWFAARQTAGQHNSFTSASGLEIAGGVGPVLDDSTAVIAISMSGNVDRTVEAAKEARTKAGASVSLTNSDGGRLSELGLTNFSLEIDDVAPFLCGTSSFVATSAVLNAWALAHDGASSDQISGQLHEAADALDRFLPLADATSEEFANNAADAPAIRFLSCGQSGIAMADYGAAKFVELTNTNPWSDDIEEFAHRQYWTMDRGERAVMLPTSPFVADIAVESAKALKDMDVDTLMVGPSVYSKEFETSINWPEDLGAFQFVAQAAALQLLAYHWAYATGFNPNKRLHLKEDIQRFKTSRRLTRRSLLAQAGDPKTAV
jgi:glucosamine 6-phosphate synthetase-like amidotransferase/phosphosugar isomerase protein